MDQANIPGLPVITAALLCSECQIWSFNCSVFGMEAFISPAFTSIPDVVEVSGVSGGAPEV